MFERRSRPDGPSRDSEHDGSPRERHVLVEQILREHSVLLPAVGWEQYGREGRGALILDLTQIVTGRGAARSDPRLRSDQCIDLDQCYVNMAYLTETMLEAQGMTQSGHLIEGYDPATEFVLGVAWPSGTLGFYLFEPTPSPLEAALMRRMN